MEKKDFISSLLCDKVVEKILELPSLNGKISVIRVIKYHDNTTPLLVSDFYPSIMERNGGVMPSFENQENKQNLTQFGASFFLANDMSLQVIQSIPALREEMKAVACGIISKKHGLIGKPDNTGHLVLYLFNPIKNDLPQKFNYMEI